MWNMRQLPNGTRVLNIGNQSCKRGELGVIISGEMWSHNSFLYKVEYADGRVYHHPCRVVIEDNNHFEEDLFNV